MKKTSKKAIAIATITILFFATVITTAYVAYQSGINHVIDTQQISTDEQYDYKYYSVIDGECHEYLAK